MISRPRYSSLCKVSHTKQRDREELLWKVSTPPLGDLVTVGGLQAINPLFNSFNADVFLASFDCLIQFVLVRKKTVEFGVHTIDSVSEKNP